MAIQTVLFILGVVLIVAAISLGIATVVYFQRMDIRGVQADLSGKTRQAGLASINLSLAKTNNKKRALAKDLSWQGNSAKVDLKKNKSSHNKMSVSESVITEVPVSATTEASTRNKIIGTSPFDVRKTLSDSDVSEAETLEISFNLRKTDEWSTRTTKESTPKGKAEQDSIKTVVELSDEVNDTAEAMRSSHLCRVNRSIVCLGSSVVLSKEGKIIEVNPSGCTIER